MDAATKTLDFISQTVEVWAIHENSDLFEFSYTIDPSL